MKETPVKVPKNFLTTAQLSAKYPSFPAGSLRFLIFKEHENGFHVCVRRIGRKVLIEEGAFLNWIDTEGKN